VFFWPLHIGGLSCESDTKSRNIVGPFLFLFDGYRGGAECELRLRLQRTFDGSTEFFTRPPPPVVFDERHFFFFSPHLEKGSTITTFIWTC